MTSASVSGRSSTIRAILWTLCAAAIFTLVFASAKFLGSQAHPFQIVFMRYAGGAALITAIAWITYRGFAPLKSPRPGIHIARTASGVFGELCVISAPLFIAYEDATAIGLTDGVIAMILAIILLKERAGPLHWLAAMTCLAGAMIIARSDAGFGSFGASSVGLGLALFGAVLSGTEMYFIKLLSDHEKPLAIMLYVNVLALLMLIGPVIWAWQSVGGADLLWLLLLGPFALLGQYCWIKALQNADAVLVVPVGYASLPFAAILGVVAFNQSLGAGELLGAGLICVGGIALARISSKGAD